MTMRAQGLHHIGLVSADAERTAEFYTHILGLREIGTGTAPRLTSELALAESPARFFADGIGGNDGVLAVAEAGGAEQGAPGIGGTHHFALAVENRDVLLRWKRRLLDAGYPVNGILDRHYFQSIYTKDPDGTIVELATVGPGWTIDEPPDRIGEEHRDPPADMVNTNRDRARIAAENWPEPVAEITPAMRIRGLHHVTAIGVSIEATHEFVGRTLGMRRVKRTSNFDDIGSYHWYWGAGAGAPGTLVTYFERRPERERPVRMGSGQVSHYALSVPDESLESTREMLRAAGLPTSAVTELGADGARFLALATRDPDGQPVLLSSAFGAAHG